MLRDASIQVGVIGVNHKSASLRLREALAKSFQDCFRIDSVFDVDLSFVLLSTCNRTEIYFQTPDLAEGHSELLQILRKCVDDEFDHALYSFFGAECFSHLARVTSGLDSAILGETEIQGQVKKAYDDYQRRGLPRALHFAFQKALKIGKQIRSTLPLDQGSHTLEETVVKTGLRFFRGVPPRILVIGASEINGKIVKRLVAKECPEVYVCNRSHERGAVFAEAVNCHHLPWDAIDGWESYPWVILGTKCPRYILEASRTPKCARQFIVDLSVPRNASPELGRQEHITLLNIDQVQRIISQRQRKLYHIAETAEELTRASVDRQVRIFREKERERKSWLLAGA